ncbi:hypothetical protein IMCC21224_112706 [Puniceibacterium sp. IMCC21224]|nr:hypothetical protein IMCC21224_112706 [Puniceibacterium sp. IMCC21224]
MSPTVRVSKVAVGMDTRSPTSVHSFDTVLLAMSERRRHGAVGFLDHGHQGLLLGVPGAQETGEIAALPKRRLPEVQRV